MRKSFYFVNLTKKVSVCPHEWGHGYELFEFSYSFDTLAVLYRLLSTDGESAGMIGWKNSRVAFIGDSPDESSEEVTVSDLRGIVKHDLRRLGDRDYVPGRQVDRSSLPERIAFVNRSKHRFIEIDSRSADEFTVGALVLFLADASDVDANDMYRVYEEKRLSDPIERIEGEVLAVHAGSWAFDAVEAMPSPPPAAVSCGLVPATRWFDDVANELKARKRRAHESYRELRRKQKRMMNQIDDVPIADSSDEEAPEAKRAREPATIGVLF
jgi:hypothetical protein